MQSLLHAREWVTLPATLYAIEKLVLDVTEQDLLQDVDWIILPVANPDGYVHTHTQVPILDVVPTFGYQSVFRIDRDMDTH